SSGFKVRLTGSGSSRCSGRVEVYYSGSWGTVCDDGWNLNAAQVVCRQMGCASALSAPGSAAFGQGSDPILLDNVVCSGTEQTLRNCQHRTIMEHDCSHSEDASVICSGFNVRLSGSGSTRCSGRVEIFYSGSWGTVCDDGWDMKDATIVCRQLDCGTALRALSSAAFGEGRDPILLDDVECTESEDVLSQCPHKTITEHNCNHGEDASVICSESVTKLTFSINPANEVDLGMGVSITCSMSTLHLSGTFVLQHISGSSGNRTLATASSSVTFNISEVGLQDEGTYQCLFQTSVGDRDFRSPPSDPFSIVVRVPQPQVSITTADWVILQPKEAEVVLGKRFTVTCSVHRSFGTGFFSLTSPAGTYSRPEVNQSAVFEFPPAQTEHQGKYSCVHEIIQSSKNATSMKTSFIIQVRAPWWTMVFIVVLVNVVLLLLVLWITCLLHRRRHRWTQPSRRVPVAATYQRGKSEAEEPHYINMDPKLMKQNEGRVGEACSTEAKSIDCCDEEVEEGEACQGVSNREDHGCALSSHVYVLDTEKRQVCSRPVGKVSSDTEDDYENVSKPSRNVSKNMYTDKDCIYENY
ncbi:scavenger receptor cysteine-rich type 1 protein M130-like, partial [Cynoglossus semilaevis]|uniref:scavenger receptor cysteine-rich type 1 protein M130-like n=1 Tax=Cynoglossus semilaevis TaxID=244447 RepID=UPI0004954EFD